MQASGNCDHSTAAGLRRSASAGAASQEPERATGGGRALIPLTPTQPSARPHAVVRQPASFLAHLIATEQALPQTRERRRVEPPIAAAVYAARRPVDCVKFRTSA